jgi:hypothetical protein
MSLRSIRIALAIALIGPYGLCYSDGATNPPAAPSPRPSTIGSIGSGAGGSTIGSGLGNSAIGTIGGPSERSPTGSVGAEADKASQSGGTIRCIPAAVNRRDCEAVPNDASTGPATRGGALAN